MPNFPILQTVLLGFVFVIPIAGLHVTSRGGMLVVKKKTFKKFLDKLEKADEA